MTTARKEIVQEGAEGVYHCISRCVRRAFLCGIDSYSGKSFEHRKDWVQSRLKLMSSGFAIEIMAFAVMSNHVHVVLRTRPDLTQNWTDAETARRWLLLFPKNSSGKGMQAADPAREIKVLQGDKGRIRNLRQRLCSISWFMRCLNEHIARRANKEDGCKGRFWEGRFKCQALLDEAAVLTCMTYVDLNPIRTGEADVPEKSLNTSIYLRISGKLLEEKSRTNRVEQSMDGQPAASSQPDNWLTPLKISSVNPRPCFLEITRREYFELVDWTGRQIRDDASGAIPGNLDSIMSRLQIQSCNWVETIRGYQRLFFRVTGKEKALKEAAGKAGRNWFRGLTASRMAFS